MGRTYESTTANFPPRVRFTSQDEVFPKGTWFIGTKIAEKMGKEFKKEKIVDGKTMIDVVANKVFTFKLHDASPDLRIDKKVNKEWAPAEVGPDHMVELAGNAQLDDKVGQVPMHQKVKITYNGKKVNPNSGRKFNDYTVEDVEE